MNMDAAFVNKYIEIFNNEIGVMKQQEIITKTEKSILEKNVIDLKAKVTVLDAKVIELTNKLNKKTANARVSKTSSKKKSEVLKDGGDF